MTPFRRRLLMKKHGPKETLVFEQEFIRLTKVSTTATSAGNSYAFVKGKTYRYVFDFTLTDLQYPTTSGKIRSQEASYSFLTVNADIGIYNTVHVDSGTNYVCTNGRTKNVMSARTDTITEGVRDYWSGIVRNLKIYEVS